MAEIRKEREREGEGEGEGEGDWKGRGGGIFWELLYLVGSLITQVYCVSPIDQFSPLKLLHFLSLKKYDYTGNSHLGLVLLKPLASE